MFMRAVPPAMPNPVAMRNRFSGEYDKWRLAFAGAKTPDQFRKAALWQL